MCVPAYVEHTCTYNHRIYIKVLKSKALMEAPPQLSLFWENTTFWSETGFVPLLGTSRRLASSECDFEHFLMYHLFTYLGKFDCWPTFDHSLIWDSLGKFSVFCTKRSALADRTWICKKRGGCFQQSAGFPAYESPLSALTAMQP